MLKRLFRSCWPMSPQTRDMSQQTSDSPPRGIVEPGEVEQLFFNAWMRQIPVSTELRDLIPKVKARNVEACVKAVTVVHALPTLNEAKTKEEILVADIHKVVKRFVNNQFIDSAFPDHTSMTKQSIIAHLKLHWTAEEVKTLKQGLLLAWQATGRTFEHDPNGKKKRDRPCRERNKKGNAAAPETGEPSLGADATSQSLLNPNEPMRIEVLSIAEFFTERPTQ